MTSREMENYYIGPRKGCSSYSSYDDDVMFNIFDQWFLGRRTTQCDAHHQHVIEQASRTLRTLDWQWIQLQKTTDFQMPGIRTCVEGWTLKIRAKVTKVSFLVIDRLWDPETQRSRPKFRYRLPRVENAQANRQLIELRRVTFSNVSTLVDGPTQHTKASTRQGATMGQSTKL